MTDQNTNTQAAVTNVQGSQSEQMNISMQESRSAAEQAQNAGPTPESLGVSQEQFDKYFHKDSGKYDWKSHAKEAEFRAQQRANKDDNSSQQQNQQQQTPTDAQQAAEQAGLDWNALEAKVIDKGDIDPPDYEALTKIGIPEYIAKDYIEGVKERTEAHVSAVTAALGGEAGTAKVKEYVQANYSAEEIADFEKRLADPKQYKTTAELLLYKAGLPPVEAGKPVNTPNANPGDGGGSTKPFASQAEMVQMQRDPRYKRDPAFRQEVMKRAEVSNFNENPRAHTAGM